MNQDQKTHKKEMKVFIYNVAFNCMMQAISQKEIQGKPFSGIDEEWLMIVFEDSIV